MVFSSFPVYLDHPNLQQLQQQDNHQQGNPGLENHQLPTLPPPGQVQVGSSPGSIRPGSMVDRARLAKIPLPEAGLKCPRCDSTNTKFCYFNNYNLLQPRHFCKTCRRYWTRGGALRSVPVGGGCRRNKRSKSSNNNSKNGGGNSADGRQLGTSTSTSASPSGCSAEILNTSNLNLGSVSSVVAGHQFSQSSTQLTPLMAAFQNLNHHYAGFQPPPLVSTHNNGGLGEMGFQLGHNSTNTNNLPAPGGSDEWRLPSLAPANLYPFQGEGNIDQASSRMEENNNQGLNSTKQFLGNMENNQYWSNGNAWTGFSGLNSSSAGHLL